MKKIKMGMVALAALTGIGSAFAFNHSPKLAGGMTYRSYYDSNGDVRWTTATPSGSCAASNLACTITSTSANVTSVVNAFPAQKTIVNGNGKSHSGL